MPRREGRAREPERRVRLLKEWMAAKGFSQRVLAEEIGVHPSMITRIFQGQRAPARRIEQLRDIGVPARLLPAPSGRPPGRPRKRRK